MKRSHWIASLALAIAVVGGISLRAVFSDQNPFVIRLNVCYVPGSKTQAHLLDLAVPARAKKPVPLIVWIHGGGWLEGSKEGCPATDFARKGYAVASINYRLSNEAIWPAQIHDCKAAIRWLRGHAAEYNIDPNRIGVWGMSAGGHLVAMLGTTGGDKAVEGTEGLPGSSRVQAVCDWCGPSDLLDIASQAESNNKLDLKSGDGMIGRLLGGPQSEKKQQAIQASPVTFVGHDDPPFLIMHGDADELVPYQQSQELTDKLKKAGVPVELIILHGAGHGFFSAKNTEPVIRFFDKTLHPSAI